MATFTKEGFLIDKTTDLRLNQDITVSEVLLIDQDGNQFGIVSTTKALEMANNAEMDLVEIAPGASPVVCKILDYGKHKFRESKKRHEARTRQKRVEVKEIKFHLTISSADYEVKRRNAERFLSGGNRVKVALWFRGREIAKQDIGLQLLTKFADNLSELADVEKKPDMEGKRMFMMLVPHKDGKKKG